MERRICTRCDRAVAARAFRANYRWGECGEQDECWECRRRYWVVYLHRRRAYKRQARVYRTILQYDPCCFCGAPAPTTDHIVPAVAGGSSEVGNLTAACDACNVAKGSRFLLEHLLDQDLYIASRARAWRQARCPRYAEEQSAYDRMPDLLRQRRPTKETNS